jgi:hypothetical protein
MRVLEGEGLEQHGVDHGEDRRVGPDAEAQGDEGHESEARAPGEKPNGVLQVLDEGFHGGPHIKSRAIVRIGPGGPFLTALERER